jgi:mannose PTS system EIIA component
MSAIVIIAHAPLASALKACATHVWNACPAVVEAVDIEADADVSEARKQIADQVKALEQADANHHVLILTDVYGATPSNIAQTFASERIHVVAGVNVPMLLRTVCYAQEPIDRLTQRALSGATQGVMQLEPVATRPVHTDKTHHD